MQTIGAFQVKTHFSELIKQVEQGDQIVITKHGHAVAKIVPVTTISPEHIQRTIQQLKAFSQSNRLNGLNWKELRDEGRR